MQKYVFEIYCGGDFFFFLKFWKNVVLDFGNFFHFIDTSNVELEAITFL